MVRSMAAGATDYSNQTIDDILADLNTWKLTLHKSREDLDQAVGELRASGYWEKVDPNFSSLVEFIMSFLETAQKEIAEILSDLYHEVKAHHCSRLNHLGITARDLNHSIGLAWNREYPDSRKDYGTESFKKVEFVYAEARNMVVDLMDLTNVAERLNDYVGRSAIVESKADLFNKVIKAKPTFMGIGIDLNEIYAWFCRKRKKRL